MKPGDPNENAPAIMRLKSAFTDVMFSSSFSSAEIEQHTAVISELLETRWKVSASRFAGKVWSNDTTPDDKVEQLNREREAARAPPGTRPTGKSMARPVPGGGMGSGLSTPARTKDGPPPEQLAAQLRRNLQADLKEASVFTCERCKQKVDVRQKFCADCGFELHRARGEPKRTLPLRAAATQFAPE